jgi:hypothetical protein
MYNKFVVERFADRRRPKAVAPRNSEDAGSLAFPPTRCELRATASLDNEIEKPEKDARAL